MQHSCHTSKRINTIYCGYSQCAVLSICHQLLTICIIPGDAPRFSPYDLPTMTMATPSQQQLMLVICRNVTEATATSTKGDSAPPNSEQNWDAFLYIVIVLVFYSFSMLYLVIQYTRREREEAVLNYYYTEYVKRERFSSRCFSVDTRTSRLVPDSCDTCAVTIVGLETSL